VNILIIGRRGEGKSTLSYYVARRIQQRVNAHTPIIFDPKRTFSAIPHTSDIEEFDEMLVTPGIPAIAYQPFASVGDNESSDEVSDEFDRFFDALGIEYHLGVRENPSRPNLGPIVLVVDEAWFLQGGSRANTKLERLVRLADSKNFYLIQASHRPKDYSTRIRAQVDELFIFRQWLEEDIEILREWCGDEVADLARSLKPHEVIRYEIHTAKWEHWNDPRGWYRAISGEPNGNADARDTFAQATA
jgi:hypothetical protein